jgi:hypothetical protein
MLRGLPPRREAIVDCPVPFGMQLWTHVSGKNIGSVVRYGLLRKEFPLRNRIGIRPDFKVGAMDGTELNY